MNITCESSCRSAVTLVEVCVVISVLALLLALLLPAVGQARATARSVTCAHRVRQVSLAVVQATEARETDDRPFEARGLPFFLSPYLENSSSFPAWSDTKLAGNRRNATALGDGLPRVWACPDDPDLDLAGGQFSYLPNIGEGFWGADHGMFVGLFSGLRRRFPDGRSQTVIISERLIGPDEHKRSINRHLDWSARLPERQLVYFTGLPAVPPRSTGIAKFLDACESDRRGSIPLYSPARRRGGQCERFPAGYHHLVRPNRPACHYSTAPPHGGDTPFASADLVTATSSHVGGVTVGLADGAVHFLSETVDQNVWTALGTAAGQETVTF